MTRRLITGRVLLAGVVLLLGAAAGAAAADLAEARFKGAGHADPIRIGNVKCQPAGVKGEGAVTFDLAWDHSWRAAWEEPAARHGGQGTLKLENWDAAWVFVKFRKPNADGFAHATLAADAAAHSVPAGAKLEVGLSDDGQRGLGVFVYRAAAGSGPNAWKGVTLRWRHGADGVPSLDKVAVAIEPEVKAAPKAVAAPSLDKPAAPAEDDIDKAMNAADTEAATATAAAATAAARQVGQVALRVCALPMVYVPECPFWLGDGAPTMEAQFSAGAGTNPFRVASEAALTLGGAAPENLGNRDGLGYGHRGLSEDFNSGVTRGLPGRFPKGYAAFYCMKRLLSRGEYGAFLDTPSADAAAACSSLLAYEAVAYAAWAGLRPLTELEFEKAGRGPLTPVPGEAAWGTGEAPGTNAPPASGRVAARAAYWGIQEMTGALKEYVVAVKDHAGRSFAGTHGDGAAAYPTDVKRNREQVLGTYGDRSLVQPAGWHFHDAGDGLGVRVGRIANRREAKEVQSSNTSGRREGFGFRCARTATAGRPSVTAEQLANEAASDRADPQRLFNEALRIENVTLAPREAKTAALKFDIAWDDSWRNATNHDAAWVFFKARATGAKDWQHVRLVADRVLNPTGYGQEQGGTPLEFVVPAGDDGFAGVFVQRAGAGTGAVTAKGVTVVMDVTATLGTAAGTLTPELQAFGIEMVYVAAGPFYLGSGGGEPNHFYQYTDGGQNTLPYRVPDAGAVPTGPQQGRLWATGATPDGSDAGELPAVFPTGFAAFYCMKFSLKQGQFAGFLGMQSELQSPYHDLCGGDWPVLKRTPSTFGGTALSWGQGAGFAAWAGLRPMTELEFEKACRGPRAPVPNEVGPGYWGIRELFAGGMIERMVSAGDPVGRRFAGVHGRGVATLPADWPTGQAGGVMNRGTGLSEFVRTSCRNTFRLPDDVTAWTRLPNNHIAGWRGVRTAPRLAPAATAQKPRDGFKLELEPLPDLREAEVGIFYLAGRFHQAGDQELKVELTSPLPDACFPDGAAARAFTAAPKAATPFKILTVLTQRNLRAARRGQFLTVRVALPGGDVLAEQTIRVPLRDPAASEAPVIGSLAGGTVPLRLTNATDRPQAVAIEMPSLPDVKLGETNRRVEVAAGGKAEAAFPVPSQVFVSRGFNRLPYRVTVGKGAPQEGDMVAELRVQSRWWIGVRQIQKGPALAAGEPAATPAPGGNDLDGLLAEAGLTESAAEKESKKTDRDWAVPTDIFKADKPPRVWKSVTHGASLWLGKLDPLPAPDTLVLAATRVIAPADREAVIKVASETARCTWLDDTLMESADWGMPPSWKPFVGRVLVNGEVVYDSRPDAKERRQVARLRRGVNTLVVQGEAAASGHGNVFVLFHDAKDGRRLDDLALDMEVKR